MFTRCHSTNDICRSNLSASAVGNKKEKKPIWKRVCRPGPLVGIGFYKTTRVKHNILFQLSLYVASVAFKIFINKTIQVSIIVDILEVVFQVDVAD